MMRQHSFNALCRKGGWRLFGGLAAALLVGLAHQLSVSHAATYGQEVVAAVLMGEARGEGEVGMLAVAEVIRTRADYWGISPLAVVKKNKHFSCLNDTTPEALIVKFKGSKNWDRAITIARLMYNEPERLPGVSRGATHYDNGKPYWAIGETPVAVIGNHSFYRLPLPRT